jgi:flagellar biosynthesis/type III secretory pathway protein FliH
VANISIESTQEKARQLRNSRIESVTALVQARQRIADLKEQLAEAEREDKRAYVRATRDGWSAEELKKLGLENATAKRRKRTTTQQEKLSTAPAET